MKCKICSLENNFIFHTKILKKHMIKYYFCKKCGFLQTEEPYWLEEAYSESINISDTGYIQRNIMLSKTMTILLFTIFNKDAKYLDFAGGYGVFVRMMRDIGFDFYWDDKFTNNLFAKTFEFQTDVKYEAITSFESFEHFVEPLAEIEKMLTISKNIIFTTELLPTPTPKPEEWWYYGLDHGQHISFYSKTTLHYIAKKYDLYYYNLNSLHIFSEKKIPNYKVKLLKLTRIGFHVLLQKVLQSKTWSDYQKVSKLS